MPSRVILLNGTSSAGKSSIARVLQERLADPHARLDVDDFVQMLPDRYHNDGPLAHEGIQRVDTTRAGHRAWLLRVGPVGQRLADGFHRSIAGFAAAGNHVVAVHILLEPAWLRSCVALLRDFEVLFVGVRCPIEVVERREAERGDRTVGFARGHHDLVHAHAPYDLEVDTSVESTEACAERILAAIGTAPGTRAFDRLRQQTHPSTRT